MNNSSEIKLKPLTEADLLMVLGWRNHPEVRQVMFTDHEISMKEHQSWWERTQNDPTKQVLLFYYDSRPVGVVNFFDIDSQQLTCHWGFYIDSEQCQENAERLKIWLSLERAAIEYAFSVIGIETLYCETFELNRAVHQIHCKFGFKEVERLCREKNGRPENVIVMARSGKKHMEPAVKIPEAPRESPVKLAFLSSANWDLISRDFIRHYYEIVGECAEVISIPFAQYRQQLCDVNSALLNASPDYCIFCERFEDLLESPFIVFDLSQSESLETRFNEYLQQIEQARERLQGIFFVCDLAPVRPYSATLEDSVYSASSVRNLVARLNARLETLCGNLSDCYLIRLSTLVERHGTRLADPGKFWHLGRIAFNGAFANELNQLIIKTMLALRGKTARVLVVDLDNTLWGGVIGDDGLQGIKVGGDFPGNVFVQIQQTLKALRERGIALAVCSKNTEAVAIEVFEKHPAMVLHLGDFTCLRINWTDKAQNIRQIAEEIGVGLSSICFLDDSPYEREAVRQMLPDVIVPEMPEDITQWPSFILDFPYLASLRLTQEDRERVMRYAVKAQIAKEAVTFANKEDYWQSLEMSLYFLRLSEINMQRVLQLLAKTNQFNMTTQRHTQKDLERLIADGAEIIPIGLSDKYSAQEIIGLVILLPAGDSPRRMSIDTFLLSCRVLGRSVETGILGWICTHLKQKGCSVLEGRFNETARNLPASNVYPEHGFEYLGQGRYRLNLLEHPVELPPWFQITEEELQ